MQHICTLPPLYKQSSASPMRNVVSETGTACSHFIGSRQTPIEQSNCTNVTTNLLSPWHAANLTLLIETINPSPSTHLIIHYFFMRPDARMEAAAAVGRMAVDDRAGGSGCISTSTGLLLTGEPSSAVLSCIGTASVASVPLLMMMSGCVKVRKNEPKLLRPTVVIHEPSTVTGLVLPLSMMNCPAY